MANSINSKLQNAGTWLRPVANQTRGLMVYVHGGSFLLGPSPRVIKLMIRIAEAAEMALFMPEYRLAPEHPCPAGVTDIAGFLGGLASHSCWPDRVVLCGEQIGPNLILAALHQNPELNIQELAAMVFYSPWLDLGQSSWSSLLNRIGIRNVHSQEFTEMAIRLYLGMNNPKISAANPLASPLQGELPQLPPVLVHASESDISLDDAKNFTERMAEQRPQTELHIWPRVAHMWERYEPEYCQESVDLSIKFLRQHVPD